MMVRPTTASDGVAVDVLLEAVFGPISRPRSMYQSLHGPSVDSPRLRRSFVAVEDGVVVGLASGLTSARHTGRNQVAIHVVRNRRRRGIGQALLEHLAEAMAEAGQAKPWQVSVLDTDQTSRAVLDHCQWKLVATSRSGTVEVASSSRKGQLPSGYTVTRHDALDDELTDLYECLYDELHPWAQPYVRYARGVPWASFLGDPLPGSIHVARDGTGAAVSIVSLHGDRACPLLAPTGVREGTPQRRAIMAALLTAVLEHARRSGIEEIEWEADDAYVDLWSALRPLSLDRWDDLLTYASALP